MKQKSIVGIVLLMGLSLLGIIGAQYLWIKQSIKVQREKFQTSVYRSLDNTVQRLEKEQSANYIFRHLLPTSSSQSQTTYRTDKNGNISIIKQQSIGTNQKRKDVIHKKDTVITQGGARIEFHTEVSGNSTEHQVWIDASGEAIDIVELETKMEHIEDSIKVVMQAMNHNTEIIDVFDQMKRELESRHNPLQQRVNLDNLNTVLLEELQQNGIDAKFEYGVYNGYSRQLSDYKSNNFDIEKAVAVSPFRVNLFPRDIFRGMSSYQLIMYFPDVSAYLIKTQGLMVSLSTIFTIFILITFFVTMRTILNQKKVSQIKTDFINNMTHEFKTPIATISLATDSILTPSILGNAEHTKNFLKIIKEENSRMNSHVERVLQMSQIEKKDFSVVKASKDVHELILRAVDNMQLLVNETGGKINTSLKAELSVFLVDEIHFSNVIINLLENALKYAKDKPEVMVTTNNTSNGIVIKVEDKGIGMSRDQQNKIFEKFYRASGGNVHNVKGFGLGLSYVKAVIDAHHGSINVKSKLNIGTEFTIQLPYK